MAGQPPPTAADDVARRWLERGYPPDLLARLRELHISNEQLDRMLYWNVPLSRFEEEARWAERGSMHLRFGADDIGRRIRGRSPAHYRRGAGIAAY